MSIGFVLPIASLGLGAILIKPKRGFFPTDQDPLIAQATIEEVHKDELEITSHPVEQGAPITDHAYKLPVEVIINCGWSNSPSINPGLAGVAFPGFNAAASTFGAVSSILSGNSEDQIKNIYDKLLAIQEGRVPFDIFTAKRVYSNMLFKSLAVKTDLTSENSLMVTATCRQVIIVSTQTITVPINLNAQSSPNLTSPVVNTGQQNLKPATGFIEP